jgi:hypothetical protein
MIDEEASESELYETEKLQNFNPKNPFFGEDIYIDPDTEDDIDEDQLEE